MRTTVTIRQEQIHELLVETNAKTKSKAVIIAIDEYLQQRKIKKIKQYKGKLEFDLEASEIRHYER